jgi:hypothetical protein
MIVFPMASAGATFAANSKRGTLKEVIPTHTPNGSWRMIYLVNTSNAGRGNGAVRAPPRGWGKGGEGGVP